MVDLWKISLFSDHHGKRQQWFASAGEARYHIRGFASEWGVRQKDVSIDHYKIELLPSAIASFLSIHAASDNG